MGTQWGNEELILYGSNIVFLEISEKTKNKKCVYVHKREACGADRHAEIIIVVSDLVRCLGRPTLSIGNVL